MKERRHVTPLPLGEEVPFSKGLMARALVLTGVDTERSYLIARCADRDLAERGAVSLDFDRLGELAADRTILAVGGHQDPAVAAGYLNAFRLLRADLVIVTMAERGSGWELSLIHI